MLAHTYSTTTTLLTENLPCSNDRFRPLPVVWCSFGRQSIPPAPARVSPGRDVFLALQEAVPPVRRGVCGLRPDEEGDVAPRLVAVPARYGQRRPVVVFGDAEHAEVRFGKELLALLLGHPSGHVSSKTRRKPCDP